LIAQRAEPELKDAIETVAEREMTTVAEFLRRELRGIVKARLAHSDDGGPAPFPPCPAARLLSRWSISALAELDLKLHQRKHRPFRTEANEVLYGGAAGGAKSHLIRIAAAHLDRLLRNFPLDDTPGVH
jgi:hypothetical protein